MHRHGFVKKKNGHMCIHENTTDTEKNAGSNYSSEGGFFSILLCTQAPYMYFLGMITFLVTPRVSDGCNSFDIVCE